MKARQKHLSAASSKTRKNKATPASSRARWARANRCTIWSRRLVTFRNRTAVIAISTTRWRPPPRMRFCRKTFHSVRDFLLSVTFKTSDRRNKHMTEISTRPEAEVEKFKASFQLIKTEMGKMIVGQDE